MKAKKIIAIALLVFGILLVGIFHSIPPTVFFGMVCALAGAVILVRSKPKKTVPVRYVASKNGDVFHRPGCKSVKMMDRSNLIVYQPDITYDQLIRIGKKPCTKCKPRR